MPPMCIINSDCVNTMHITSVSFILVPGCSCESGYVAISGRSNALLLTNWWRGDWIVTIFGDFCFGFCSFKQGKISAWYFVLSWRRCATSDYKRVCWWSGFNSPSRWINLPRQALSWEQCVLILGSYNFYSSLLC